MSSCCPFFFAKFNSKFPILIRKRKMVSAIEKLLLILATLEHYRRRLISWKTLPFYQRKDPSHFLWRYAKSDTQKISLIETKKTVFKRRTGSTKTSGVHMYITRTKYARVLWYNSYLTSTKFGHFLNPPSHFMSGAAILS